MIVSHTQTNDLKKGYGTGKVGVSHFTRGRGSFGPPLLQNSVSAPAHILLICFKVKAEESDQVARIAVQRLN